MGNSLNKKILQCESLGLLVKKLELSALSACCSQLSVSHRYLVAFTMVQWLACDISHLKGSLISSALQLKRLAWVQWLTLKQCNSQLVTFLQIRDILIGLQAQSQSNFFIIATSIIVFIIIVINCHLAFKLDHQVLQTVQQLVILKFSQLSSI